MGRRDEALAECIRLAERDDAPADRANEAGTLLFEAGRFAEALAAFERALAADPGHPPALGNRAAALRGLGRTEEALEAVDRVVARDPDAAHPWANRGCFLIELGRPSEGVESLGRALALDPANPDGWYNLAGGLGKLGRIDEAAAAYDKALALRPAYPGAEWNKCLLLLRAGRAEAWRLFESRWNSPSLQGAPAFSDRPVWDGRADLAGRTLALHYEQGFGDSIQMLRYVRLLADRGADVILAIQPELAPLCQGLPCRVVPPGAPFPAHDLQAFLMSLPAAFGAAEGIIPDEVPYLAAPEPARARWAERLGPKTRKRAGLVWSGSRGHHNDAHRSIPLAAFEACLPADLELIPLQKDIRPADRVAFDRLGMIDVSGALTDFGETAGLIANLDLVISVDTSVVHLAGALGKPLWLLLPEDGDYRWLDAGETTPWYPTARLLRRGNDRQWRAVLDRLGRILSMFSD